jgi:hypothetical protein
VLLLLPLCGAIPAWRDGLRVPASFFGLAKLRNPSTFLTTFSTFQLFLFGIAVAQALSQQATGTKTKKEVMNA